MSTVIHKTARKRKPNVPVKINWSNPLTRGLEHLYIALPSGMYNLIENRYITNPASTAVSAATKEGIMTDFDGAVLGYDRIDAKDRRSNTIGGVFVVDTYVVNKVFCSLGYQFVGTPFHMIRTHATTASKVGMFYRADLSSNQVTLNTVEDVANGDYLVMSSSGDGANFKFKLNNDPITLTGSTTSSSCTIDTIGLGGLQRTSASSQLDCKIGLVWLYDRPLSDAELASLHANPYQLFQPRTQLISFADTVAAALGIFPRKIPWHKKPNSAVPQDNSHHLSRNVVLHNIFNEGGGTKAHDLAGTSDGTLSNSGLWSTCKEGHCLDLNAGNYYVSQTGNELVKFSYETLFIPNSTASSCISTMAETPGSGTHDRSLYINSSGQFEYHVFDGAAKKVTGTSGSTAGKLYHILVTADGTNNKIYINGVLEGTTAAGDAYTGYTTPEFVIGYGYNGASSAVYGDGKVILSRFYDKPLSAPDVRALSGNYYQLLQPRTQFIDITVPAAVTSGHFPRKVRWTKQPSGFVKPDYGNPVARGLSTIFYPVGDQLVDVANTKFPTTDTSTQRIGKLGKYRDYANQDTRFANIPAYHLTGAMTLIVIADVDALTNYGALISCADTNTTNGWELRLGEGATGSEIHFVRMAAFYSAYTPTGGNKITAGTKDNFIAVATSSGTINAAPSYVNVNGNNYTSFSSAGPGTGAQAASSDPLYIGRREDGVTKLDGAINFIALFDRELSFEETEQIRANPYQLLQPRIHLIATSVTEEEVGVIYERTLSDSASVADQQQAYEEKLRLLFSNLAVTDEILSITGTIYERILSSSLDVSDEIKTQKEVQRLVASSVAIVDTVLADKELFRVLQDNIDLVDSIARTIVLTPQNYSRILSDSLEVQDLIIRETTGQILQLIVARLTNGYDIINGVEGNPYNIEQDSEVTNIQIDSEDV